jgi:NAD(P)-dependent dehydrogenase (short-subunit alcohol dehydrogenase family)
MRRWRPYKELDMARFEGTDCPGYRRLARPRPRHRAGTRRAGRHRGRYRDNGPGAADIQQALDAAGISGWGAIVNVTEAAACEALIGEIEKKFGAVSVLVNNAGITRDNLAMRMKDDEWDQVIETNLKAVFRLSKLVMRGMMKARFGRIINITSVVGEAGNPGQANYAAAKAGVAGMSRALAQELGSRNITVNCVAPGFIDTDMTRALPDAQRDALLARFRWAASGSRTRSPRPWPFWHRNARDTSPAPR